MFAFIEPSVTESLLASLRELAADALPLAAVAGLAAAIAAVILVRVGGTLGRGRRPRSIPAAA